MAAKKEVVEVVEVPAEEVVEVVVPTEVVKYRCDFDSYDEYNAYTGLKG